MNRVHHFALAQWEGLAQASLEDRPCLAGQAKHDFECASGSRVGGAPEDLGNLIFVEAGDDRSDGDGGVQAGIGQCFQRLESFARRACEGFDGARIFVTGERNAHGHVASSGALELLQHVHVAPYELAFGDDRHGRCKLGARFEASACEAVLGFDRLIAIGVAGQGDEFSLPRASREVLAKPLDHVDLDHDLAIEVGARAEAQVRMGRAGVAIGARMEAASVRIHAPAETDVGALVLRKCALGALLEHQQVGGWRLSLPFEMGRFEPVRRILP